MRVEVLLISLIINSKFPTTRETFGIAIRIDYELRILYPQPQPQLIVGLLCLSLFYTMGDSRLVHGICAKTRRLHLELGINKKEKGRKNDLSLSCVPLAPRTAEDFLSLRVGVFF